MSDDVGSFELLNFPVVPERSHLFHLEPIGVGQSNVECLASYVQRLMDSHLIDLDFLMDKEVLPRLGKHSESVTFFSAKTVLNTGWMIEGMAGYYHMPQVGKTYIKQHRKAAESFVQVIEGLTLRQNLDRLTVMPLEAVAPTSGLLRRKLAWCPDCLNDWQQKVSLTYWPLLWSIKTVIVCPQHKQLLREVCPTCYCYQELLPSISNIEIGRAHV